MNPMSTITNLLKRSKKESNPSKKWRKRFQRTIIKRLWVNSIIQVR